MARPSFLTSKRTKVVAASTLAALFIFGGAFYIHGMHVDNPPNLAKVPASSQVIKAGSSNISNSSSNSQSVKKANVTTTQTGTTPPTVVESNGAKAFSGFGLNFKFSDKDQGGSNINYHVSGSTVYLGTLDANGKSGYSIQVFTKVPGDSLQVAITKQLLNGYSTIDCPITTSTLAGGNIKALMNYASNNQAIGVGPKDASKCPQQYIPSESGAYFIMNTAHPDKFAFVTTGQTPLDNVDGKGWNNTISFN